MGPGASCRVLPAGAFPTSGQRPGVNHTPVASAMGPSLARTVTVTSLTGTHKRSILGGEHRIVRKH